MISDVKQFDRIISRNSDQVSHILKGRKFKKQEITRATLIKPKGLGLEIILGDGSVYPLDNNAIQSMLQLLNMSCNADFIKSSFNVANENVRLLNKVIRNYYDLRFQLKLTKTGKVSKINKLYARPVNDFFSEKAHGIDEYDVRHITTGAYQPITDQDVKKKAERLFDLRFHEASITKYGTKLRYFSDNAVEIEIEGREILLGIGFINSEFGRRSLGMSLFEADCECANQFITSKQKFSESIPHRIKDELLLNKRIKEAVRGLEGKLSEYGKLLKNSNDIPLKINKIGDIMDDKARVNQKVKALPKYIKELVVDTFEQENLGMTNFGLRSAMTRVVKDNRELEEHIILTEAIESLVLLN